MNPFRAQRMQALAGGVRPVRAAGAFRAELTGDSGELWIYDVIDPWGGYWGISASEIVQALQAVGGGPVTVHVNSPGGDVFEAIAIHANFERHPGMVTMIVEGHAASAASAILTAADRVEVVQHAQVMIHDAWSFEAGDAAAMRKTADLLDRTSQNLAGMYAAKGGGAPEEWRALMQETTWYVGAEEIIASGLADAVVSSTATPPVEQQVEEAYAQWDLSIYGKVPSRPGGDSGDTVKIDAKIMRPVPIPADVAAKLAADVTPEFRNAFNQIITDIKASLEPAPTFGNKFREVSKEMTNQ